MRPRATARPPRTEAAPRRRPPLSRGDKVQRLVVTIALDLRRDGDWPAGRHGRHHARQAAPRRPRRLGARQKVGRVGAGHAGGSGHQQEPLRAGQRDGQATGEGEARALPRLEADAAARRLARRQLQDLHVRQYQPVCRGGLRVALLARVRDASAQGGARAGERPPRRGRLSRGAQGGARRGGARRLRAAHCGGAAREAGGRGEGGAGGAGGDGGRARRAAPAQGGGRAAARARRRQAAHPARRRAQARRRDRGGAARGAREARGVRGGAAQAAERRSARARVGGTRAGRARPAGEPGGRRSAEAERGGVPRAVRAVGARAAGRGGGAFPRLGRQPQRVHPVRDGAPTCGATCGEGARRARHVDGEPPRHGLVGALCCAAAPSRGRRRAVFSRRGRRGGGRGRRTARRTAPLPAPLVARPGVRQRRHAVAALHAVAPGAAARVAAVVAQGQVPLLGRVAAGQSPPLGRGGRAGGGGGRFPRLCPRQGGPDAQRRAAAPPRGARQAAARRERCLQVRAARRRLCGAVPRPRLRRRGREATSGGGARAARRRRRHRKGRGQPAPLVDLGPRAAREQPARLGRARRSEGDVPRARVEVRGCVRGRRVWT
mmetsp:Transcript_33603/g.108132  ORF Transcript_33603/g.108132 Transcript_33603/m.108132 type:complete len:606 (-) Transcript_33603:136-1953(-)